jgi:dienelactone hydrolase
MKSKRLLAAAIVALTCYLMSNGFVFSQLESTQFNRRAVDQSPTAERIANKGRTHIAIGIGVAGFCIGAGIAVGMIVAKRKD